MYLFVPRPPGNGSDGDETFFGGRTSMYKRRLPKLDSHHDSRLSLKKQDTASLLAAIPKQDTETVSEAILRSDTLVLRKYDSNASPESVEYEPIPVGCALQLFILCLFHLFHHVFWCCLVCHAFSSSRMGQEPALPTTGASAAAAAAAQSGGTRRESQKLASPSDLIVPSTPAHQPPPAAGHPSTIQEHDDHLLVDTPRSDLNTSRSPSQPSAEPSFTQSVPALHLEGVVSEKVASKLFPSSVSPQRQVETSADAPSQSAINVPGLKLDLLPPALHSSMDLSPTVAGKLLPFALSGLSERSASSDVSNRFDLCLCLCCDWLCRAVHHVFALCTCLALQGYLHAQ